MALVWADGYTGTTSLAELAFAQAQARTRANMLRQTSAAHATEIGLALLASQEAKDAYAAAVAQAEANIKMLGADRTHALVIGVGRYADSAIPAVTTSVRGAWAFVEWLLTEFNHPDRPLGSVELLLSGEEELDFWIPSSKAAVRLGMPNDQGLAVDPANFANIDSAYQHWLARAAYRTANAALFYFAGHGLWKTKPYLLPEDAQIANSRQSFARLIDIQQTAANQYNSQPELQCFFLDACQELPMALLSNLTSEPGIPLGQPSNAAAVPRDTWLYMGSRAGKLAYGPRDNAPFFTQELLACLRRRGAGPNPVGAMWPVTTSSLKTALEASCVIRAEKERQPIRFSALSVSSDLTADLCRFASPPEVFLKVWCQPRDTMCQARLFVETEKVRCERETPALVEWHTVVTHGGCRAGASFDARKALICEGQSFTTAPPLVPVQLLVTGNEG